ILVVQDGGQLVDAERPDARTELCECEVGVVEFRDDLGLFGRLVRRSCRGFGLGDGWGLLDGGSRLE
ncbi:hypothetical protein Q6283_28600, partial [Klebsiella pneumoniae]|uniref:hypothetical protein n=1 Tax=Klebsiella pneumoniae TaxID=573 RepID=UPI00272FBF0A